MKTKNSFDYTLDYSKINFRETPELYRVGRGEQGGSSCGAIQVGNLPTLEISYSRDCRKVSKENSFNVSFILGGKRFHRGGHGEKVFDDGMDTKFTICESSQWTKV